VRNGGRNEKKPNAMEVLFGEDITNPAECTKYPSPDEGYNYKDNYYLQEQVYKSLDYYIKEVTTKGRKEKYEQIRKRWPAKNSEKITAQMISGDRWDFILGVEMEDGTFLLGYVLEAYMK
jgi:hypothetical protein